MYSILSWALVLLSVSSFFSVHAAIFVSTDITGAQVQTDINHTQWWEVSPSGNIQIDGANFTMKAGPSTSADVSFLIYQGTWTPDFLLEPSLFSVTLTNAQFNAIHGGNPQSFDWVLFQDTPILLTGGITYTGVLFSDAIDTQSTAYFIKGGANSTLSFVDENGNTVDPGVDLNPPSTGGVTSIPIPGSLIFMFSGSLLVLFRKKDLNT